MLLLVGEEKRRRSCIIFWHCSLLTRVCLRWLLPGGCSKELEAPIAGCYRRWLLPLQGTLAGQSYPPRWLLHRVAGRSYASDFCYSLMGFAGGRRWSWQFSPVICCLCAAAVSDCLLLDKRGEERTGRGRCGAKGRERFACWSSLRSLLLE
ncbi:hypothetical protein H5410_005207 [Solanum commersonii]|uniref:Uncharacterized protein n=1 Tax=Solanum commersonii TaxID=4109 RepID=A0A9J6A607_SOLCO|nr:hypothetical protein H5410_005207 [Solanum commersonii]